MNQLFNPVSANCTVCNTPTKPRVTPMKQPDKSIVMECRWICGRCGAAFKRGIAKSPTQ